MILTEEFINRSRDERQQHLDLTTACLERGGDSVVHRGVLAQYLGSDIPSGYMILLCHACHNPKCSNPRHIYWGTPKDNLFDAVQNGTRKSIQEMRRLKYSEEEITEQNKKGAAARNKKLKDNNYNHLRKPKSEEHKAKIAEAIRKKHENGEYVNSPVGRKKKTLSKSEIDK